MQMELVMSFSWRRLQVRGSWIYLTFVLWIAGCAPVMPAVNSQPTVQAKLGTTAVSRKDRSVMVYVPAGQFPMGSEIGLSDEQPVHTVYLDAFWLDRTEVTNAMYRKCVEAGKCQPPSNPTYFKDAQFSSHPVVYVSWVDAGNYYAFVDRRLPTEAEWENAATWDPVHSKKQVYPWGDTYDCSISTTIPSIFIETPLS